MSRQARSILAAAIALAALVVAAPAATAATTLVLDADTNIVTLTGAASEASHLQVTKPGTVPATLQFTDTAGLTVSGAASTCTQVTPTTATCPLAGLTRIDALLGAGNDELLEPGPLVTTPFRVDGGAGNDALTTGPGADTLTGGTGNDTLHAGAGGDRLDGSAGGDLFDGGAGVDIATWATRTRPLRISIGGTTATDGEVGEGDDVRPGVEIIVGGSAADTLTGGPVADQLQGRAGNDTLLGGGSDDRLYGGAGTDKLVGGPGSDLYDAGPGNDTISTSARPDGGDIFRGGSGNDVLSWALRTTRVVSSPNNAGDDGASGEGDNVARDFEVVRGGSGGDTLQAAPGKATTLNGGGGADSLLGSDQRDRLDGGPGADRMYGFAGMDVLLARDGVRDLVVGGDGIDSAAFDSLDMVLQCEVAR